MSRYLCLTLALSLQNLAIVERIKALAEKKGCQPGQLALAWVHTQVRRKRITVSCS